MRTLFDRLATLVSHRPGTVVAASIVLTLAIGALAPFAVNDDTVAVDDELSAAQDVIDETFGDPTAVTQIVVTRDDGGDVRTVDALRLTRALTAAIEDSELADALAGDGAQPAIASFLGGADLALERAPIGIDDLDDGDVPRLQDEALAQLPPQVAGLFDGLLASQDTPTAGLVLVFTDGTTADPDQLAATEGDSAGQQPAALAQQRQLAAVVDGVDVPAGYTVETFSFGLLLTSTDIGPEIGRLFGTALLIILLVLAVVYAVRPEAGQRWRIGRRTAADVGLTLAVIVFAVVWMQGLGVLLGPGFLGLIGPFSPQTQIVPILIIGLGVDFAIHLLARYRAELGDGATPDAAWATGARTVGLTLLLCTGATAIGFLTNLASPVEFLATLGVLAAVGITAAFGLTMTFLPAARLLLDRRAQRLGRLPATSLASQAGDRLPRAVGRTAWLAERAPVPTLLVATLAVVAGGYGFTQLDSAFELTDFVPQDEPLLATFEVLQERFDGGFDETTEVLLRGELDRPEAHEALVEAVGATAEVDGVQTLGDAPDATSVVSVLTGALDDGSVGPQLRDLGVTEDGTVADDADVTAVYELLLTEVEAAGEVLARADDGTVVSRVTLRTSAGQAGAGPLAVALTEAFAPVTAAGVDVTPTSPRIVQAGLAERIEDSQITSLLIALGAAMALLVLHFTLAERRPVVGVLTVLPVGLVLALTFGAMAATGIPLNPVTATLAALSIGIGVPFTIHVTSRWLEERSRRGIDGALRRTLTSTGGALAGSALTTAIGFGILVTSTLTPFEQLGYVIVFAIASSLIAAVLVLPSMLALYDRGDARRRRPHDETPGTADGARAPAGASRASAADPS